MSRRQQQTHRARRALLCGVVAFFGVQLALAVLVEKHTELRDPKFGYRMMHLRERLAEQPDRPLVVVLGSSRVESGFRPALLPEILLPEMQLPEIQLPAPTTGKRARSASLASTSASADASGSDAASLATSPALVFNFGLPFQGVPAVTLLGIERLLAADVRPRHLFVEILVPALNQRQPIDELIKAEQYDWEELALFRPYCGRPTRLYRRWLSSRITPGYGHRLCLVSRYGHDLLPHETRQDLCYYESDGLGWRSGEWKMTAEERRQRAERSRSVYYESMHDFEITAEPDQALRKIVALCRQSGIGLTFFTMPEAGFFRDWYSPQARQRIADYFERLSRESGVPIVDARGWIDDEREFSDGHHLMDAGAQQFTNRFLREGLQPALSGPGHLESELARRADSAADQ